MSYQIKGDWAEHADARTSNYNDVIEPKKYQLEIELEVKKKFQRNSNGTLRRGEK